MHRPVMYSLSQTDLVQTVRAYLLPFSVHYPSIDTWFAKVRLETKIGKRRIWVATLDGQFAGLAITKLGDKAKLCHFSVAPFARESGVGMEMMRVAIRDLLWTGTRAIHVTTSDEVTEQHGLFFDRCGFDLKTYIRDRYRRGSDEFVWTATREELEDRLFKSRSVRLSTNDARHLINIHTVEPLSISSNIPILDAIRR